MRRFHLSSLLVVFVLASGVFWTACKPPKPKVTTPAGPTREQIERARADSLRAVQEAERLTRERAETEQRQREEADRRRREAEEAQRRAAAEAAQKKAQVLVELKTIYFDYDKSNIRDDQRASLDGNVKSLKDYQPTDKIRIEGHCDERGTVEYNLALGERRASSVKRYLTDSGIDKKRVSTISYGKSQPTDPGHDESAWWKNRRTESKRQQ